MTDSPPALAIAHLLTTLRRRQRAEERWSAAEAAMREPLPLDAVLEVTAPEVETEDLVEVIRRVRSELADALTGTGITPRRAEAASRRIVALAFLRELVGINSVTEAASMIGASVDSIERDSNLLAQLGTSGP